MPQQTAINNTSAYSSPNSPNLNPPYAATPQTNSLIQAKNIFNTLINTIRFIIGFALLGAGATFLYKILLEIYNAYQDIQSNAFINILIGWLTDQPIYIDSNQTTTLLVGSSGAVLISVLLGSLIALIALRAAFMFFTAGIKVLSIRF